MREFTCIVCGTKGIDTSVSGCKIFCSRRCREIHRSKVRAENLIPCQYNDGVICDRQKCSTCGWNPKVEKRRKEKLGNG